MKTLKAKYLVFMLLVAAVVGAVVVALSRLWEKSPNNLTASQDNSQSSNTVLGGNTAIISQPITVQGVTYPVGTDITTVLQAMQTTQYMTTQVTDAFGQNPQNFLTNPS